MGAPTPLVWTFPCPWRSPNVILRSSREHFWEMLLIRRRDDRGSEDRSCTFDNSCFELVEHCRYVTGGMEIDLTPLPSTTDVSFAYNTPTPFVVPHSLSSSNFQMNFARSRQSGYRWYDLLLCAALLLRVHPSCVVPRPVDATVSRVIAPRSNLCRNPESVFTWQARGRTNRPRRSGGRHRFQWYRIGNI